MKKYFFVLWAVIVLPMSGFGQGDDPGTGSLKVGDDVPELVFHQMINHTDSVARLSDYEGKAVLLDFWATWCVPCISSFPKLEKLQEKYRDKLKIILVSSESKMALRKFYSRKASLKLPTVKSIENDSLHHLFPHRVVPHLVWIGQDRKVHAITEGVQLTDEAMEKWLDGKSLSLPAKNDVSKMQKSGITVDSIESFAQVVRRISIDSSIVFQSVFRKYDPRLTGYVALQPHFVDLINTAPASMAMFAYGYRTRDQRQRVLYDLKDSTLAFPPYDEKFIEWQKKHSYSYRLILPMPDSTWMLQIMQRDIREMFGLRAYQKKVRLPCLVLRRYGNSIVPAARADQRPVSGISVYHLEFINQPIKRLIYFLQGYKIQTEKVRLLEIQKYLPLFDETGVDYNITFKLHNIDNLRDMDILNKSLRTIGLELVATERDTECLIITDKQANENIEL